MQLPAKHRMYTEVVKHSMMTTGSDGQRRRIHTTYPMLLFLFFFGSIFGFLIEGVWFFFRHGQLESHSALVWGPFCIVYGFGAIAVYLMAILLHRKKWPIQFVAFTVAGGAVEYFTGLFQELVFGSTSWDYSRHFLSLGGHVSLKMALLWGAIGIVFIRLLYPLLCQLQEKLRGKVVRLVCILVSIFLAADMIVSAAAVLRWKNRQNGVPAANQAEALLDTYYGDEKMEQIYSNLTFK